MQPELMDRYRHLRRISERHRQGAMACTAKAVLIEHAKQLGLAVGDTIVAGSEGELALLADLAVYTAKPGRSRAIDRYARSVSLEPESEEARVLEAMREARFCFWQIKRHHEAEGVIVTDWFRDTEVWLLDQGVARSCKAGMGLAGRLCWPAEFAITCSGPVPVTEGLLEDLMVEMPVSLGFADPERTTKDPRFAAAVYRAAMSSGVMEHVEYRVPAAA